MDGERQFRDEPVAPRMYVRRQEHLPLWTNLRTCCVQRLQLLGSRLQHNHRRGRKSSGLSIHGVRIHWCIRPKRQRHGVGEQLRKRRSRCAMQRKRRTVFLRRSGTYVRQYRLLLQSKLGDGIRRFPLLLVLSEAREAVSGSSGLMKVRRRPIYMTRAPAGKLDLKRLMLVPQRGVPIQRCVNTSTEPCSRESVH